MRWRALPLIALGALVLLVNVYSFLSGRALTVPSLAWLLVLAAFLFVMVRMSTRSRGR